MPLDPNPVAFRRLTMDDLNLMHRWLNTEHVSRWWDANGDRNPSYEHVVDKYTPRIQGDEKVEPFLITYGATPVGFIQIYLIRDHPDYARAIQVDDGAAGVDLFIGEADYVYRGLDPHIIVRFLHLIVFARAGVESCVIGPAVSNTAAIRAYEKARFRHLKTVKVPGESEPEYLMRIGLEEFVVD